MNKKELKALQAEWYKKLEDTGFKDIEDTTLPDHALKRWHKQDFLRLDDNRITAIQDYFNNASDMLNWYEFKNNRELLIWTYHCEGDTVREIAAKINLSKSQVHFILKKLKFEMQKPN